MDWDWISPADTAKLLRKKLAKTFPGVKFYVRTDVYSGGASIDIYYDGLDHYEDPNGIPGDPNRGDFYVRWTPVYKPGMPSVDDVKSVADGFSGRTFDGMIDMAVGVDSFLTPAGDVVDTASYGTAGSHGSIPAWGPDVAPAGSKRVRFGASYVFVNDTLPYDVRSKGAA